MGTCAIAISGFSGTAMSRAKGLEHFHNDLEMRVCLISNVGVTGLNIAFCSCLILLYTKLRDE
jgi:hypothetical protein